MAHAGVELAFDIFIANFAQEVDGFIEIFVTNDTRILSASDEKNREVRMAQLPALFAISIKR